MIPALTDYTKPFGTIVTRGIDSRGNDNKGGLNVQQVNDNIIAPFVKMRGVEIPDNVDTTVVEYDAKLYITAASSITLTLGNGAYDGCIVTVVNTTNFSHTLSYNEVGSSVARTSTILPNSLFKILWNGTTWVNITAPSVGEIVVRYPQEQTPSYIYPCTTWEEVTKYDGAFFRAEGGRADPFIEEGGTLTPQSEGTAKNGLSFSGTRKKTGYQSSNPSFSASGSHGHSFSSPNPSSFDDPYGGGDDWSQKGAFIPSEDKDHGTNTYWITGHDWVTFTSTHTPTYDYAGTVSGTHKHSFTPKGSIVSSDSETRPVNYTIQLWKRTA
jgi:hypothetical protein